MISIGCDAKIAGFRANQVHALSLASSRSTPTVAAADDTSILLTEWFGTPDSPKWPRHVIRDDQVGALVNLDRLMHAAGPVRSDQNGDHLGLYREHCVQCHALEGSGAGPASIYQDPYPRDFRAGVFKWKSTRRDQPPTRADLRFTLTHGIAGTGMPSFSQLPENDLDSLVDYVIYMSIRGQLERELLDAAVDELGYEDTAPEDLQLRFAALASGEWSEDTEAMELAIDILNRISGTWSDAEKQTVSVPDSITSTRLSGEELELSIERGRDLFHGQIANCAGCHGPSGGGGIVTLDYDDWTKEYSTRLGITPTNQDAIRPMRKAGAMPPRPADPRNLQLGVFRGGGSTEALYRRVSQGIAGTPMPGVEITSEATSRSLSIDQAADLIHYVQSLGPSPSNPESLRASNHD